jgi:DNA-binding response OmpR family regulator
MRILIVEDNRNLASGLQHNLELEGHVVGLAYDGTSGLRRAREPDVDLIVLDLMIPKPDGYQILRTLREAGIETPVIILTARGEEADKVRGFRLGADDYVTKPFGLLELLARVDAIRRRIRLGRGESPAKRLAEQVVEFGDVRVDVATRTVLRSGEPVSLRPMEFDLLMALARHQGEIVSRIDLLEEVWGYDSDVMSRTVDTHVRQLRSKLEHDPAEPSHLLTVRKAGYRLKR